MVFHHLLHLFLQLLHLISGVGFQSLDLVVKVFDLILQLLDGLVETRLLISCLLILLLHTLLQVSNLTLEVLIFSHAIAELVLQLTLR